MRYRSVENVISARTPRNWISVGMWLMENSGKLIVAIHIVPIIWSFILREVMFCTWVYCFHKQAGEIPFH